MQFKLHSKRPDLPVLAEALHLPERLCCSQRQNEKNQKGVHEKGMSNIKGRN